MTNSYKNCGLQISNTIQLTHTAAGRQTKDIPPNKCYFWLNCVKAKGQPKATENAGESHSVSVVIH